VKNNQQKKLFSRFLIIWFGQLVSTIGSGITAFALGVYVFQLTGLAADYSLVILAAFLPALLLKPVGGAMADRFDRRLLMIIGDSGSALSIFFIIAMLFVGVSGLWIVYLGSGLSSVFIALQNPAYKASVTDLVDKSFYSKASGLMQLAESARYLISPVIAGLLISVMDIKAVLLIDSATFLVAIATVSVIKNSLYENSQATNRQSFMMEFTEGLHYTFANKKLILLLTLVSFITFFIGVLQALLGPLILSFATAKTFGLAQTLMTTGMLISSLFIGIFSQSAKKISGLVIALFFCGIFFSLLGISRTIVNITLFGFLLFLSLPFVNTSLDVLVRSNVANRMQGRVWSIVSLISQLGLVIALASAGYLADKVFNPWLNHGGVLATSIGNFIGVGPGRGIGLLFIISGLFISLLALIMTKLKSLRALDKPLAGLV
jgi:MFS family permease